MTPREQALYRWAPILIGAAGGVLALVLILPFLAAPRPAMGETLLLVLGAVSVLGLTALAGHAVRSLGRERLAADALRREVEDLELYALAARHDLREPLRKIITFGERLRDGLGPAPDARLDRYAERMADAAERMQGMLDELARHARVNDANTRPERFAAGDELRQLVTALQEPLSAVRGRVSLGPLPDVTIDRAQFRTLFAILLGNAIQYARTDVPLEVAIAAPDRADGRIEIRCADNGIGFAEDKAELIFRPLERLHARDAYPGTGIGLATARKIAERAGGELTARGEIGNGAVFTLILPRQKASL